MAAKPIFVQAVDTNGAPYSGAKLNVYDAGTTTPRAIYTESGLGTASANPAIADANGVVVVWVNDAGGDIKVTLTNSAETVTPHSEDNVPIASLTCYPVLTFQGDQSLLTTSSPTFGGMTLTGALTGTSAEFNGNVDLNGYWLVLDADGDSYFHTTADDAVQLVIGGSAVADWTTAGVSITGTLTSSGLATFTSGDTGFTLQDDGDATKKAKFEVGGISGSTTRTFTFPDANGTIALIDSAQTISAAHTFSGNITLSGNPAFTGAPDFSGVSNKSVIRSDLGITPGGRIDVTDLTAMKALTTSDVSAGNTLDLIYLASAGDGGDGEFRVLSGSASSNGLTADDVLVVENTAANLTFIRMHRGLKRLKWWAPARDGATDDASKIQAAIDSLADGETLLIEEGDYAIASTIDIGDGTTTSRSTVNSFTLEFEGLPSHPEALRSQAFSGLPISGVRWTWTGAAGGTMVEVNGPIQGLRIRGAMQLRGIKSGGNRADYGLRVWSMSYSEWDCIAAYDCGNANIYLDAQAATSIGGDANGLTSAANVWTQVISYCENASGATALRVDGYRAAGGQDVTQNRFEVVSLGINAVGGVGLHLGFTDFDRIEKLVTVNYIDSGPSVTSITQANPAVVTTSAAHNFSSGDEVFLKTASSGMTEVDGVKYTVANVTATTFELSGVDSTSYTAYTSGGYASNAIGVYLDGSGSAPFPTPDQVYIQQASVGQYCSVKSVGAVGETFIEKYSTNDGGLLPHGVAGVSGEIVSDDIDNGVRFGDGRSYKIFASADDDGVHFLSVPVGANPTSLTWIGALTRQVNDISLSSFAGFGLQLGHGIAPTGSYDVFFNSSGDLQLAGTTRLSNAGAATLTQADIDNVRIDGNTVSATDTNGDLVLSANGSGVIDATGSSVEVNAAGTTNAALLGMAGATLIYGTARGAPSGNGFAYRSFDDHAWYTGSGTGSAGTLTMSLDSSGNLDVTGGYEVDGTQVVGNQQSGTGETAGFTAGAGTGVNDDSTFTGNVGSTAYRISDIVKALKNHGLIAS